MFLKKNRYNSLKNVKYDEIEIDFVNNNENTTIIPCEEYSNAVFKDTTSSINIKYLKSYFDIKIAFNSETT